MPRARVTQEIPGVRVTPVNDTRAYDTALASLAIPADALEARARDVARRFGVDENLSPRERCMAIMRAMGKTAVKDTRAGPNARHMNALLDAVESGHPERWRKHPISYDEIRAAQRATGRKLKQREPGEDDES